MRILLGDKLLEFTDLELDYMYLDEGNESVVFKYGNDALKIYKEFCHKERLAEEDALRLSCISTERILMPKEIIRDADTGKFIGYSVPYIEKYPSSAIARMKMRDFLRELDVICSDIDTLSNAHVDIEDLHVDNILYNGSFFIGDPGSFEFRRETPSNRIYQSNIYSLSRFVINEVFGIVKLSKPKKKVLDSMFVDDYYIGEQIREAAKSTDTVSAYVKRMTK